MTEFRKPEARKAGNGHQKQKRVKKGEGEREEKPSGPQREEPTLGRAEPTLPGGHKRKDAALDFTKSRLLALLHDE